MMTSNHTNLVDPLHVVPQLLQVLDIPVADLADDEVALAAALARARLARLHGGVRGAGLAAGRAAPRQGRDGDGGRVGLAAALLAQALGMVGVRIVTLQWLRWKRCKPWLELLFNGEFISNGRFTKIQYNAQEIWVYFSFQQ